MRDTFTPLALVDLHFLAIKQNAETVFLRFQEVALVTSSILIELIAISFLLVLTPLSHVQDDVTLSPLHPVSLLPSLAELPLIEFVPAVNQFARSIVNTCFPLPLVNRTAMTIQFDSMSFLHSSHKFPFIYFLPLLEQHSLPIIHVFEPRTFVNLPPFRIVQSPVARLLSFDQVPIVLLPVRIEHYSLAIVQASLPSSIIHLHAVNVFPALPLHKPVHELPVVLQLFLLVVVEAHAMNPVLLELSPVQTVFVGEGSETMSVSFFELPLIHSVVLHVVECPFAMGQIVSPVPLVTQAMAPDFDSFAVFLALLEVADVLVAIVVVLQTFQHQILSFEDVVGVVVEEVDFGFEGAMGNEDFVLEVQVGHGVGALAIDHPLLDGVAFEAVAFLDEGGFVHEGVGDGADEVLGGLTVCRLLG